MPIITDIVLDEWISLGETRCSSISAIAMREPPPEVEDMPLNSAAWDPIREKFYACRGGYVFRFDSDGVLESSARFIAPEMDDTYLDYDQTTDKIWVVMKRSFGSPSDASFPAKYLVAIDPVTLVATTYNFRNQVTFGDKWTGTLTGPRVIRCDLGVGWVIAYDEVPQIEMTQIFRFNLTAVPPSLTHQYLGVQGGGWGDILLDGVNLWFCSNDGFNSIDARTSAALGGVSDFVQLNGTTDRPCGITRNPAGAIYAVQGTQFVLKGTPAAAPALRTVIDLGRPDATPFNIKYNNVDFKIYIPCWKDNTVVVLDPSDDSFVVKTGFDSPFDVVFGTRPFAVQHGSQGLKEII